MFLSSCEKKPTLPTVITTGMSGVTQTTASSGGNVTDDGGAEVTARGVCWCENENPVTLNNNTIDGSGTGSFTSSLTSLTPGTTYYVRAYAINSVGTAYGKQVSFTASPVLLPTLTTAPVSTILSVSAISGGNITDDGGGEITARGVCWSTSSMPDINDNKTIDGTGAGGFTSHITGLEPDYGYNVRAYATNSAGTAYGDELYFVTNVIVPTIETREVTNITSYSATCGGVIRYGGDTPVLARGLVYGTLSDPYLDDWIWDITIDGSGTGQFTRNLTGLIMDTVYYIRAYATNEVGTGYGDQMIFRTSSEPAPINFNPALTYGSVTDIDGNSYKTITIGTQIWMAENLKTGHYNDGTDIPYVPDESEWSYLGSDAYCWYKNDESTYKNVFGALYNWYAVNTGKLCPSGWHVPSNAEIETLSLFLGGDDLAGGKLKEAGNSHWNGTNEDATNESGFTALPGGLRAAHGEFQIFGTSGYYSLSDDINTKGYIVGMGSASSSITILTHYNKSTGVSVRCIKD